MTWRAKTRECKDRLSESPASTSDPDLLTNRIVSLSIVFVMVVPFFGFTVSAPHFFFFFLGACYRYIFSADWIKIKQPRTATWGDQITIDADL